MTAMVRIGPPDAVAGPTMCSRRARKRPSKKPAMMVSVGPDFGNTVAAYRTASRLAIRRENGAASAADERAIAGKIQGVGQATTRLLFAETFTRAILLNSL